MGAVLNLRTTPLVALRVSAGVVAVSVLSFVCVMLCILCYFVVLSAPNLRHLIHYFHGAL